MKSKSSRLVLTLAICCAALTRASAERIEPGSWEDISRFAAADARVYLVATKSRMTARPRPTPAPEPPLTEQDQKKIAEMAKYLAGAKTMAELQTAQSRTPSICGLNICMNFTKSVWVESCCYGYPDGWESRPASEIFVKGEDLKTGSSFSVLQLPHQRTIVVHGPSIPADAGDGSKLPGTDADMTMRLFKKAVDAAVEIKAVGQINDARGQ